MRRRRLSALTTGLTFVLLLVGVYTKEVGADLSCGMNWPLCDGAVFGLFPANVPSAIEWFHRFLALVVGVLIVLTVYRYYRAHGPGSRVTQAGAIALLMLPVQAGLGALTVLKAQLFAGDLRIFLEPLISVAHYGTGVLLFTSLVAATLWAFEDGTDGPTPSTAADPTSADD
mgnify:CR=1 FL=1